MGSLFTTDSFDADIMLRPCKCNVTICSLYILLNMPIRRPLGRRIAIQDTVSRERKFVGVERWSCSRGASRVVEHTLGRLRDWSL